MKKWEYHLIMVSLFLVCLGIIVVIIMLVYPYDILYVPPIAKITDNTVKRGETLVYEGYMNKKIQLPSTQQCYFVDSIQLPLASKQTNRKVGEYRELVAVYIPKILPPDKYIYECDITYSPNPFRTIVYHWETEPFTVTE